MILTFPNDLEPQKKPAEHALAHKVYGNDSCEKGIKLFIACSRVARKYLNLGFFCISHSTIFY